MSKQIYCFGLVVRPTPYKKGVMYAEVVPAAYGRWYRQFLPWVGRWWYEVHTDTETWAYAEDGSDGAYTLSGCIRKAMQAVDELSTWGIVRTPDLSKASTEELGLDNEAE